jgi:hypothetical protein
MCKVAAHQCAVFLYSSQTHTPRGLAPSRGRRQGPRPRPRPSLSKRWRTQDTADNNNAQMEASPVTARSDANTQTTHTRHPTHHHPRPCCASCLSLLRIPSVPHTPHSLSRRPSAGAEGGGGRVRERGWLAGRKNDRYMMCTFQWNVTVCVCVLCVCACLTLLHGV